MRRSLLLVLVLLSVSAWPTYAQLFPSGSQEPKPSGERVLVDTVLYVNPPRREGLCAVIEPGQLAVTVHRVSDAVVEKRRARFSLTGLMADPDAQIDIPVTNQDTTTTIRISGSDRYCWGVSIDAPETEGMSNAQRGGYVQTVAVRITLRPD